MRIRDFSIRSHLAILILSASALAVLLASAGFAIYERQSDQASSIRELTALADTLGANTAASLAFDDSSTARTMLSALATEPHILGARLFDNQHRTFAEYRNPHASGLVMPAWRRDGYSFSGHVLILFRGVYLNGERTGSIGLIFDLSDFHSRLIEYLKISLIVLLLSVLLAFVASLRIARFIADPMVKLADLAKLISNKKDYSVRATVSNGREAALLIRAFNDMLARIESREHDLSAALDSLRESEERYALAARGANDGLWDWNLVTNEIYFSPRWNDMLGYSESERWRSPEPWFSHIHADDRDRVRREIEDHCAGRSPEFASEYRMRHESGRYIWTLSRGIAVRDVAGRPIRMAGSQTDITEGKIADPLTGIPNRLYFLERLESAIEAFRQEQARFAVLFIDLDQFKLVNDSLGHAAGDELLVDLAGRLRASVRSSNRPGGAGQSVVARIGGDEFAMLVSGLQQESEASVVAARIIERLSEPFFFEGRRIVVSASIGIALDSSGVTPEDLLRNADTAMYQAKTNGKARFEYFNEGLRERVITRFETEAGLRKAIDSNQLVVHYQPILSVTDSRIRGFEALVRWIHPERGMVPPGEFIPVAEESDLILLLGRWVLREACCTVAEWQKTLVPERPFMVSVNVSSRQLGDGRLVEDVESALAESGLRPECLALEITESSIMGNTEQTLTILHRLKSMGVRLEIDDFGTGYSSLSYLQRLPFGALKIDRSFVRGIGAGNGSLDIVRAIVELAHSLRMQVIAEGVETSDQLDALHKLGCDLIQGFLISKPVDASSAESFYRNRTNVISQDEEARSGAPLVPVSGNAQPLYR